MKVTLVQLYGSLQPPDAEPLSIEILAASALMNHPALEITLSTLSIRDGWEGITTLVDAISVESSIVGVSIPQSTFDLSVDLLRLLYQKNPGIKVVLGHALPTYSPDVFLQLFPRSIIVRGWGEETFAQLIDYFASGDPDLKIIPNLCFLYDNDLYFTHVQWPKKIVRPLRWNPQLYFPRVEASRGCQHDLCTFCTRHPRDKRVNSAWHRRAIAEVVDDLQHLKQQNKAFFTFTDEDFVGNDLEGAQALAEALAKVGGIHFSLSVRADNIVNPVGTFAENEQRRRLFELLRDAGLYLVFIGIESLSTSQLKRYAKGVTADDCVRAMSTIQSLGIGIEMGFIPFDPLLSRNELLENLRYLDESGVWMYAGSLFHQLRPQKGSGYARLLIKSELIGEYNVDLMLYDHQYSDSTIGEIANFCNHWSQSLDGIYRLARNMERIGAPSGIYSHFTLGWRLLSFRMLRELARVRISENKGLETVVLASFAQQRQGLVRSLLRYLSTQHLLTETEAALRSECEAFVTRAL